MDLRLYSSVSSSWGSVPANFVIAAVCQILACNPCHSDTSRRVAPVPAQTIEFTSQTNSNVVAGGKGAPWCAMRTLPVHFLPQRGRHCCAAAAGGRQQYEPKLDRECRTPTAEAPTCHRSFQNRAASASSRRCLSRATESSGTCVDSAPTRRSSRRRARRPARDRTRIDRTDADVTRRDVFGYVVTPTSSGPPSREECRGGRHRGRSSTRALRPRRPATAASRFTT